MNVESLQSPTGLSSYFLPASYQINDQPKPCRRSEKMKPDAQWHVYELAAGIDGNRVLDVGCGDGIVFMEFFSNRSTLGLDMGDNVEICRNTFASRTWDTIDLDTQFRLPDTYDLVVCADVIEHLRRPEYLLAELARLNSTMGASIVISTPERDLKRGAGHRGPPPNSTHVREWNRDEFRQLLQHFNLQPEFALLPTSKTSSWGHTTMAAVCRPPVSVQLSRGVRPDSPSQGSG